MCDGCLHALDTAHTGAVRTLLDGKVKGECVFSYEYEHVKRLILYMKRNPDSDVFGYCAAFIAGKIRSLGINQEIFITFVPRSTEGLRENGFDQSEYLVKRTARILGNAKAVRLLKRAGKSTAQKKLAGLERNLNISGKFRCVKTPVNPKNIIIVDDVLTTGSSISECASVLKDRYPEADIYFAVLAEEPKNSRQLIPERKN